MREDINSTDGLPSSSDLDTIAEEEQPCRVIRIDPTPTGKAEVGIEFLKPSPNFWRVAFPPEDWVPRSPEITSDTF